MSAGLVAYKLCERELRCEGCPLDAALRGREETSEDHAGGLQARSSWWFPDDRRYAPSHTWVCAVEPARWRIGIDALAALLLAYAAGWRPPPRGAAFARGEVALEVDLGPGTAAIGMPIAARVERCNAALHELPTLPVRDPYGAGWLLEVELSEPDGRGQWDGLLRATAARERAELDVRRFRRRVAMHLLAGTGRLGKVMVDGGDFLVDLRQMLGASRYLALLAEFLE